MDVPGFFDESSALGFTRRFRAELAGSTHVDCAVTSLRWSPITLPDCDLRRIMGIRLVVAELRAAILETQVRELMGRGEGREALCRLERVLEHRQVRAPGTPYRSSASARRSARRSEPVCPSASCVRSH